MLVTLSAILVFKIEIDRFTLMKSFWSLIKPGTWNIPEHPGTSNNYDNYEKNM